MSSKLENPSRLVTEAEYAIIGAGFAGLPTAYFLTKAGKRCVILEQESKIGQHASGRNAAFFRHFGEDVRMLTMAIESGRLLEEMGAKPLLRTTGSLLFGSPQRMDRFVKIAGNALECERLSRGDIVKRFSFLERGNFHEAIFVPADGVLNIKALLQLFVDGACGKGAKLMTDCQVVGVEEGMHGVSLKTKRGKINCRIVINATGAWSSSLAKALGGPVIPFTPLKRQLHKLRRPAWLQHSHPFFWHFEDHIYFRADGNYVLVGVCEEIPTTPGDEVLTKDYLERLKSRLQECCPQLATCKQVSSWACQRSFSPDRLPVVGWDPKRSWLFWVSGLGGQGVSLSAVLGKLASDRLLAGKDKLDDGDDFLSPARFT